MAAAALLAFAKKPGNLEFDLQSWLGYNMSIRPPGQVYIPINEAATKALAGDNHCGTTACAMGLFAILPQFKAEGLHITVGGTPKFTRVLDGGPDSGYPHEYFGYEAATAFFDLSFDDVEEVFSASRYSYEDIQDPIAVWEKIVALLRDGGRMKQKTRDSIDGFLRATIFLLSSIKDTFEPETSVRFDSHIAHATEEIEKARDQLAADFSESRR